jgi:hypothetical protein
MTDISLPIKKNDKTRNQRQARRRKREKQWLEANGWRSWEALHTALINGTARLFSRVEAGEVGHLAKPDNFNYLDIKE